MPIPFSIIDDENQKIILDEIFEYKQHATDKNMISLVSCRRVEFFNDHTEFNEAFFVNIVSYFSEEIWFVVNVGGDELTTVWFVEPVTSLSLFRQKEKVK